MCVTQALCPGEPREKEILSPDTVWSLLPGIQYIPDQKKKISYLTGLTVSRLLPGEVNRTLSFSGNLTWTFFSQLNISNFNALPLLPTAVSELDRLTVLSGRKPAPEQPAKEACTFHQAASVRPLGGTGGCVVTWDSAVILSGQRWTKRGSSCAPRAPPVGQDFCWSLCTSQWIQLSGHFFSWFRKWRAELWESFCSDDINKL